MTHTVVRRTPLPPTSVEWAQQVGRVVSDLPLFLTSPLYRHRHLRWGATQAEVASRLPGDDLVPNAQYRCTRAITVDAPPASVWPWLVQVGCGKAGFYSNDLLDNLGRPSARDIVPELQHLEIGQWVSMAPTPSESTAFKVNSFEVDRWLLWTKPDSTWAWALGDLGGGRTRLVTRVHARYDWSKPPTAVLGVVLMEFGDFAMMRRMLLGIKERAEMVHYRASLGSSRNRQVMVKRLARRATHSATTSAMITPDVAGRETGSDSMAALRQGLLRREGICQGRGML